MSVPVQGEEAVRLLIACGFKLDEERGSLAKIISMREDENVKKVHVEVRDYFTGGVPDGRSSRYAAKARYIAPSDGVDELKPLEFSSLNASDIMAFAVAVESDINVAYFGNEAPEELCFTHDNDMAIHNPFADICDWISLSPTSHPILILAHPAELYGAAYCQWRDERAKLLLQAEPSPAP